MCVDICNKIIVSLDLEHRASEKKLAVICPLKHFVRCKVLVSERFFSCSFDFVYIWTGGALEFLLFYTDDYNIDPAGENFIKKIFFYDAHLSSYATYLQSGTVKRTGFGVEDAVAVGARV